MTCKGCSISRICQNKNDPSPACLPTNGRSEWSYGIQIAKMAKDERILRAATTEGDRDDF